MARAGAPLGSVLWPEVGGHFPFPTGVPRVTVMMGVWASRAAGVLVRALWTGCDGCSLGLLKWGARGGRPCSNLGKLEGQRSRRDWLHLASGLLLALPGEESTSVLAPWEPTEGSRV